jgi:glycosyltransferase involved in cell wall biosynthesis
MAGGRRGETESRERGMNDRGVRLSICIATFNRSKLLRKTLDSLVYQILQIEEETVEVVVGDNCSSDATEQIGRQYAGKYAFIRYLRNDRNIGAERNYYSVVRHASGDFVWMLSDDDFILEGAVVRILRVIQQRPDISYIFVNYRLWSESDHAVCGGSNCVADHDQAVPSGDDFHLLVRYANSFIASGVCRRTSWIAAMDARRLASYWPQLHIANEIVQREKSFIVAEPLLLMRCLPALNSRMEKKRQGNDGFYLDAHLQFIEFLEGVTRQTANPEVRRMNEGLGLRANLFQIMMYKCVADKYQVKYLTAVFLKLFSVPRFRKNIHFWLRDAPLLFAPGLVARQMYAWQQKKKEIGTWAVARERYKGVMYSLYRMVRRGAGLAAQKNAGPKGPAMPVRGHIK